MRLEGVEPAVWRDLLVPGTDQLSWIADILLAAMGWNNSHLHQFLIGDARFGMHADDWADDEIDEATVTLIEAIGDERQFIFEYDFGDGWEHTVEVRSIGTTDHSLTFAVCTGGAYACPPDDVGGPDGYRAFLEAPWTPSIPNAPAISSGRVQRSTDRPSTSRRPMPSCSVCGSRRLALNYVGFVPAK